MWSGPSADAWTFPGIGGAIGIDVDCGSVDEASLGGVIGVDMMAREEPWASGREKKKKRPEAVFQDGGRGQAGVDMTKASTRAALASEDESAMEGSRGNLGRPRAAEWFTGFV